MAEQDPIIQGENGRLKISRPMLVENSGLVDPGDLTKIAPYGNGVYGYQPTQFNPLSMAPKMEAVGGVLFFDNGISHDDFRALSRITNSDYQRKDYAAFYSQVPNLKEAGRYGFIRQLRLVPKFALKYLFEAINENQYQNFPEQELTMAEAMWAFMEKERQEWGTFFGGKLD